MDPIHNFAFDLDENGHPLMNCMTIIAGKNASGTGRVMVGHDEDDGGHITVRHTVVPPMDWPEGTRLPAEEGRARIPQVAHTLGYYWVEFRTDKVGLSNSDMFYNDHGVLIVTNSMGTSRESMDDERGLCEGGLAYNLRRALAERATSAREGARLLMELVEKWGYAPSGRAYTLADKDEAFMFQLVHGRHYVGARVPDDQIVVMPNFYNFHTLHDCPEMYYSKDIVEYAIERGWYVPTVPGDYSDFDFAVAYQDPREHMGLRNVLRQKHGQRIALGRDWSVEEEGLPFSIPAEREVGLKRMADILSTHYEGTPDRCEWYGPGRSPHDTPNIRNICTGTTLECAICDFDEDPRLTTLYTAFGRPCELPFVPMHPLMGIPEALEPSADALRRMETHLAPEPSALHSGRAAWHRFRRVESSLEMLYADAMPQARVKLDALLKDCEAANGQALERARALMAEGREEEARALIVREDGAFLDRALADMEALRLPAVAVDEVAPLSLSALPETIRVTFASDRALVEGSLVLGLTHTDTREKYASAVPGSLRAVGENRYEAAFPTEPFAGYLHFPGCYDFILGGTTRYGAARQGIFRVLIED